MCFLTEIALLSHRIYVFIFMLASQDQCCKCSGYFDCQDYQCQGHNTSTVYQITPMGMYDDLGVFCDFDEDGEGWIVSTVLINSNLLMHK